MSQTKAQLIDGKGDVDLGALSVSGSALNDAVSITSDNYFRMASGTGGIQFGGDTAAANALDDYEEGTFSPVIEGTTTAGTGTYQNRAGRYTKIGQRVYFQLRLNWNAHTGTGDMIVANLPFSSTSAGNSQSTVSIRVGALGSPASTIVQGFVAVNAATITLESVAVATGTANTLAIDTNANIYVSGHYEAA
jgi:hypothetical protein